MGVIANREEEEEESLLVDSVVLKPLDMSLVINYACTTYHPCSIVNERHEAPKNSLKNSCNGYHSVMSKGENGQPRSVCGVPASRQTLESRLHLQYSPTPIYSKTSSMSDLRLCVLFSLSRAANQRLCHHCASVLYPGPEKSHALVCSPYIRVHPPVQYTLY